MQNPPFDSFAFTMAAAGQGRSVVRLARREGDLYSLHVEQGSGGNPRVKFDRDVPMSLAQGLKDALQEAGVFGWPAESGSAPGAPACTWNLRVVFKRDVFEQQFRGGNDLPAGFDVLLEQLYRLDLPRPDDGGAPATAGLRMPGGLLPGELGAFDLGAFGSLLQDASGDSYALEQMQQMMAQAQGDPAAFQQMVRREFAEMPADEQNALIDELAALGLMSRAWWEDFLRGGGQA